MVNLQKDIVKWIKSYAKKNNIKVLVVGVSGGIDSAVVSTLCAHTKVKTYVLTMPIRQSEQTHSLSIKQAKWLKENFKNVVHIDLELSRTFDVFEGVLSPKGFLHQLAAANSRSRLRMMTLYHIAQSVGGIVVGTGNKVEDFGVGFFTKYGDGGVDISPIGDLLKTEVWQLGKELGVPQEIIDAKPTDGLWHDGRTDEDQLGMDYPSLEQAMKHDEEGTVPKTAQGKKKLERYRQIRNRNLHKMLPIPVYKKS